MRSYFYTYPAMHLVGRGLAAVLEVNVGDRLPRAELNLCGVHTNVGTKLALRGVFRQHVLFLSVPHCFLSGFGGFTGLPRLPADNHACNEADNNEHPIRVFEGCIPLWRVGIGFGLICFAVAVHVWAYQKDSEKIAILAGVVFMAGGITWLAGQREGCEKCGNYGHHGLFQHSREIVPPAISPQGRVLIQ